MKKVLFGGFLSLTGTLWGLGLLFIAGNNLVTGWDTGLGRLLSTVTGTADVGPDRTSTVSMALPPLPADAVWLKIYLMDGLNAPVCPAIRLTAK